MKIFFAGEGADDIGDWAKDPPDKPVEQECPGDRGGVLHALVGRIAAGHRVGGGATWASVRRYRVGQHRAPETRSVLAMALAATEASCSVLVFARNRERNIERETYIERGLTEAAAMFPELTIAGGMANEDGAAWLLGLLGDAKAEAYADAGSVLETKYAVTDRLAKRALVENADLRAVPASSRSLRRWLAAVRAALAR